MSDLRCSAHVGRRRCSSRDLTILGYVCETPTARTYVWGTAFEIERGPGLSIALHCNACGFEWTSPSEEAFEAYTRAWSESEGPEAVALAACGGRS